MSDLKRPPIEKWKDYIDWPDGIDKFGRRMSDREFGEAIDYIVLLEVAILQELKCHGNCDCYDCQHAEQVYHAIEDAHSEEQK